MFCTIICLSPLCLPASLLVLGLINTLGIAVILPSCLSSPWKWFGNTEHPYIPLHAAACRCDICFFSINKPNCSLLMPLDFKTSVFNVSWSFLCLINTVITDTKQMFQFLTPKRFRFRHSPSILNGHINLSQTSGGIHVDEKWQPCLNIQYHYATSSSHHMLTLSIKYISRCFLSLPINIYSSALP